MQLKQKIVMLVICCTGFTSPLHAKEMVIETCKKYGCDFYRFYDYFEQKKERFCSEKQVILSSPKKRKYLKYIIEQTHKKQLPPVVAMVPIVESSLNAKAKSSNPKTPSIGMWQFKKAAARDMGLDISPSNDERYDWKKSSQAGVKYIKWLSHRFNDDANLAVLSYNIGIGNLKKLMKELDTTDAWHLSQSLADDHAGSVYLMKYFSYYITLTVPEVCAI